MRKILRLFVSSFAAVALTLVGVAPASASDSTPPTATGAISSDGLTMTITFSEPMQEAYNSQIVPITMAGAAFDSFLQIASFGSVAANGTTVEVVLRNPVDSTVSFGFQYLGSNLMDLANNPLAFINASAIDTSSLVPPTYTSAPMLTLSGFTPTTTTATGWTRSADDAWMMACSSSKTESTGDQAITDLGVATAGCIDLSASGNNGDVRTLPTDLESSYLRNGSGDFWSQYNSSAQTQRPYILFIERSLTRYAWSDTVALPGGITSQPALRALSPVDRDSGVWELTGTGGAERGFLACANPVASQTTLAAEVSFNGYLAICRAVTGLYGSPLSDIEEATVLDSGLLVDYATVASTYKHVFYWEKNHLDEYVWTASLESSVTPTASTQDETIAPVQYPGPALLAFSKTSAKPGDLLEVTGKRLNLVSSISIDGLAAVISNQSSNSLTFLIPQSIGVGLKDLVMSGSFGRLTVIGPIAVSEAPSEFPTESASEAPKVNVGSLGGYIAVYAKGLKGKTLSWKIAGKWFKTTVQSDYQVFQRRTLADGKKVNVDLYIDGQKQLSTSVTTK